MGRPATIYANVVNFRLTPREFVLEFGAHFPDRPMQGPPSDYQPDARVVLPAAALNVILQALSQAVAQQSQQAAAAQAKQTLGFKATTGSPKETP